MNFFMDLNTKAKWVHNIEYHSITLPCYAVQQVFCNFLQFHYHYINIIRSAHVFLKILLQNLISYFYMWFELKTKFIITADTNYRVEVIMIAAISKDTFQTDRFSQQNWMWRVTNFNVLKCGAIWFKFKSSRIEQSLKIIFKFEIYKYF